MFIIKTGKLLKSLLAGESINKLEYCSEKKKKGTISRYMQQQGGISKALC